MSIGIEVYLPAYFHATRPGAISFTFISSTAWAAGSSSKKAISAQLSNRWFQPTRPPRWPARRSSERRREFAAKLAPVIAEIQAAGVQTLRGICECLNRSGIATRNGKNWCPATVRNFLRVRNA